MNVQDLTDKAKLELFKKILNGFLAMEDDDLLEFANDGFLEVNVVDYLDYLDEEDYFGTEGWKHRFNVE